MVNRIILALDVGDILGIAIAILGTGILGGITAFRKAKPEMSKITVEIAGQAVIVQKTVIESLQNELIRQGSELRTIEIEHEKCQEENREFKRTIDNLQKQLTSHSSRMDKIEGSAEAKNN